MIDWNRVLSEIQEFEGKKKTLVQLNGLAVDSLYGSMWGLNHRYMTLQEALTKDFANIVGYTICRIRRLVEIGPISFRVHKLPKIRRMGFGTYGWKYNHKLIALAVKHKLLIDTAEGYGYGRVETELGEALISYNAEITTKVSRSHMSPKALPAAAYRSRKKLGVVPHYQLHFPNNQYSDEQMGQALVGLRKLGTIQSIGLGNCSVDMIESMQAFLSDYSGDVIRSIQMRYNLADRRIERSVLPYCQKRGIAIIAYSPLGQKFSALRTTTLDRIAIQHNCTSAQIALAWVLRAPGIIPIPRTNNVDHLKDNINAINIRLTKPEIRKLNNAYR